MQEVDQAYMTRLDSGCTLAMMAITGCDRNTSGSDPAWLLVPRGGNNGQVLGRCVAGLRSLAPGSRGLYKACQGSRGWQATAPQRERWGQAWNSFFLIMFLFRFYIYIYNVHCILGNKHHQCMYECGVGDSSGLWACGWSLRVMSLVWVIPQGYECVGDPSGLWVSGRSLRAASPLV